MWVLLGCVAAGFAVAFGGALWAQDEAKPATTMLFDFENEDDVKFCEAKADTETAASTEHATSGKQSLKVTMKAGADYPGLYVEKFPTKDWSGNAALKFDVFADEAVTLGMTLKDPNSKNYETRFNNDKISLNKGANTVTITLGDVGDKIDLKKIKSMSLFCPKPEKDVTIYVDNMRLEK
jgi:hypothetical protein